MSGLSDMAIEAAKEIALLRAKVEHYEKALRYISFMHQTDENDCEQLAHYLAEQALRDSLGTETM
jgi:hypothetical protein